MQISKSELIKALDVIKPGLASSEGTIDQSTSFAFMDDHIITYNDSISISYPFESGIKGAISAKELYSFLNKLSAKKDTIHIELKKNEVQINAGKEGKAGIKFEKDVKLPLDEIKTDDDWHPIPKNMIEGLNFCTFSTSKSHSKPLFTCVHVKGKTIESTDNFRATKYFLKKKVKQEFLIPATSIKFLTKFDAIRYNVTKSWVNFKSKEDAMFSCRIFNQEYPDISGIMNVGGKKVTFPDAISEAVEKAVIFSEKEEELSSSIIKVKIKKNAVSIKGEGNVGWFKEKVKAKYKGGTFSFKIASNFFLDMLKINNTCRVDKKSKRIKFDSGRWEHVVLLLVED